MSSIPTPNLKAGSTRVVLAFLCLVILAVGAGLMRSVAVRVEKTAERTIAQESSRSSDGKARAPSASTSRDEVGAAKLGASNGNDARSNLNSGPGSKAVAPAALKNRTRSFEIRKHKESISLRASGESSSSEAAQAGSQVQASLLPASGLNGTAEDRLQKPAIGRVFKGFSSPRLVLPPTVRRLAQFKAPQEKKLLDSESTTDESKTEEPKSELPAVEAQQERLERSSPLVAATTEASGTLAANPGMRSARRPASESSQSGSQSGTSAADAAGRRLNASQAPGLSSQARATDVRPTSGPKESRLTRAQSFNGDLRDLPYVKPIKKERPEREPPKVIRIPYVPPTGAAPQTAAGVSPTAPSVAAPSPIKNFDGLDFANFGAGHPPDTNGDVGPQYYIQSVNTSVGIYNKSTGARVAAFTFDTFMSQGNFGNLCDTDNFGDPVVLYDTFEDRWIITDFAFQLSGNDVVSPPGAFQCFAASKTSDPVAGGWNFYSINITDFLNDYPKLGIWPDGVYMSANLFGFPASGSFAGVRVWALNKAQMYAGATSPQVVSFDAPTDEFTLLPSNARLQAGTPPAGSPNYFATVGNFINAESIYKFHVDWNSISTSTFTGPFITIAPASWADPPNTVPSKTGNSLDTLAVRLMMQNQYTNLAGVESLWTSHTVEGTVPLQSGVRYYQVAVTGGTVAATTTQAFTHSPDATTNRFMPSVAVDRAGDMALGYSASSATIFPAIRYAGRLFSDPLNMLPQTETSLIEGTGTQTGSCGGTCERWGDYSTMSLDPDGCTFWYTNEYYAVSGLNDLTRIGSFKFPSCTIVTSGTVQGTVTDAATTNPINGATVALGSRTTTTNVSGVYTFSSIPSGTYPSVTASFAGYNSSTATNIVVTDGNTTTQNFALNAAAASGCITDTTQADFQTGLPANVDLTTSAGNVILLNAVTVDQQNTNLGNNGVGITTTTWGGQTFTPAVTGQITKADVNLFCSSCSGTTPNLTLSVRATSGGLPTGADLATTTITGFSSGASAFYTGTFGTTPTLTAGTQYALAIRPVSNPSAGTYALTRSGGQFTGADVYAGGARVSGATSGTVWTIPLTGGVATDAGFRTYMKSGFAASGNQVSSLKDANPIAGATPTWTTLSWNATVPANTNVQFQAAASNNPAGPFNFVGPNGTAATFFTNGGSLAQFNGLRYLKYKALLSTTNSAVSPTLSDVTICFSNTFPALTINTVMPPAGRVSGGQQVKVGGQLANLLTVTIGGVSVPFSYTNGTIEVTFTSPAHAAGAVNIDLAPVSGPPLSKTNAFAYLATVFTDDTLVVGTTTAKAQHIIELRQAVDALRAVAGLGAAPWTDLVLSPFSTQIKAVHILELRSNLEAAAALLGYPAGSYTDSVLNNTFQIKRVHIEELRQRIRNIAG